MTETWHSEEGTDGSFPPVVTTRLGQWAFVGMVLSAIYQLLATLFATTSALLLVGGVTYALVQYDGGLTSNEVEAMQGMVAGIVVFLASCIPMLSALAAGVCAFRLWRGGRRVPLYVVSGVSMVGPTLVAVVVSLSVLVVPVPGAVALLVAIAAMLCVIATGLLAIVAASRAAASSTVLPPTAADSTG